MTIYTPEEKAIHALLDWEADASEWQERTASEIAHMLNLENISCVGKALRKFGYEKTRDMNIDRRYRILHGSPQYNVPPRKQIQWRSRTMTAKEIAEAMMHIANCTTHNKNLEMTARKCASEVERLDEEIQRCKKDLEEARTMLHEQNVFIAALEASRGDDVSKTVTAPPKKRPKFDYDAKLMKFATSDAETEVMKVSKSIASGCYPKAEIFRKRARELGFPVSAKMCGDYILLFKQRASE